MANINLSQSSLERKKHEFGAVFDRSIVISLSLLAVSFGSFLCLSIYDSMLRNRITLLDEDIAAQMANLDGESVDRVADFGERLKNIDMKLSDKSVSPQDMFATIEKLMVIGVSLDAYKYDMKTKTLSLKIVSADFKGAARQVMALKSHEVFKNVTVGTILKADDGSIVSNVTVSL